MQRSIAAGTRRGLLLTFAVLGLIAALIAIPYQFRSEAVGQKDDSKKGLVVRTTSQEEGLEEMYDIREDKSEVSQDMLVKFRQKSGKDASLVANLRDDFVRGEDALKQRIPNVKVEYNNDIRIPEVITPNVWRNKVERLTGASDAKKSEILRSFIKENNQLVGMEDGQIDALKVTADYTNPDGNLSFAHLEQFINNVPVFRGEVKAGFTKNGEIIRVINNLAPGLDYESLSTDFRNPADAVKAAAQKVNYELKSSDTTPNQAASSDLKVKFGNGSDWDIQAEKMYFPTEPGVAVPAWRVLIWKPVSAYYVIIDAETGTMLWRKNISSDQTQSATYNVYANSNAFIPVHDSPNPFTPGPINPAATILQGARVNRSTQTRIGNEAPYTFNNNGWITDGANITDGNAVEAGVDRDTTNGVDAASIPTGSPNRTFNFPFNPGDPSQTPTTGDAPTPNPPTPCVAAPPAYTDYQKASATQMFWVMNWYHDELYRLGFTEAARNFQGSNFGRGGVENDRVSAEGQDCGGVNNANFATPADGTRGRMQMYVWNGPTPDFDGTIDADVIIHEVTHGTSNRLHGNGSGLGNMGGMMGEGWSDWYAHTMLSEPTDPINGIYTTGGYATHLLAPTFTANYYYGIRRFPKAVMAFTGGPNNRPHNPLTFGHINSNCDTTLGTPTTAVSSAFPRSSVIGTSGSCNQVHNAGEIWSSALWEVRARFITRLGWAVGNRRVLQVVTDGMKLAPLNPTFLQERDAIIAAAAALPVAPEASADVADVREGFRIRGMGFSASVQSTAAVTEAFDFPNVVMTNPFSVSDSTGDNDGFPEPGETVLLSVAITNATGGTINNVTANVNGGSNVNYGNIADGATVTQQIPYLIPANAACGSMHQVTININSAVGAQSPQVREFRLGAPVGGAPVTFSNNTLINLPMGQPTTTTGVAGPYPSDIVVSGLSGNKTMKVEITGITHTFPGDLDFLLVGPGGQKYIMLSDSGGGGDVNNLTFTLSDGAAAQPSTTQWAAGDFRPYNTGANDPFAAPAPVGPYTNAAPAAADTFTSVFGTAASGLNGTWSLYVVDDASGDFGTMAGWKLTFEANDFACNVSAKSRADFDGDGRTDVSVFRGSNTNWYMNRSTAGFASIQFGAAGDILTPGDFDGDGKADVGVFRPSNGTWYRFNSGNGQFVAVQFGSNGDVPVPGDFDADGKDDVAVFRPSNGTWYRLNSSNGQFVAVQFGANGDVPTNGDFDGDSKRDVAVFRPSDNNWYRLNSGNGQFVATQFGSAGDIVVPADYDGDNKDDIAVFRPSNGTWYRLNSGSGQFSAVQFGANGDVPAPGDFDGDGRDDQAVFRNGTWYMNRSTSGFAAVAFGITGDAAIPGEYLQ